MENERIDDRPSTEELWDLALVARLHGGAGDGELLYALATDAAHDQFLRTGRKPQGILFAAVALSGKLGSAGGHFLAGVGIDLIHFPLQSDPGQVAPHLIARLGLLSLLAAPLVLAGVYAFVRYRISRASYEAARRSPAAAS